VLYGVDTADLVGDRLVATASGISDERIAVVCAPL